MTTTTTAPVDLYQVIAKHLDEWLPTFREVGSRDEVIDAIRSYTSSGREYVDTDWLKEGPWDGRFFGAPHCVDITPGGLPETWRITDCDRIVAEPYIGDDGTALVQLLTACESEEHNTPLTLDEAEAYGHAILTAVAAARKAVAAR